MMIKISIRQKLLDIVIAHPHLVTFGISLGITMGIIIALCGLPLDAFAESGSFGRPTGSGS